MSIKNILMILILVLNLVASPKTFAADDEDNAELNVIELELERSIPKKQNSPTPSASGQESKGSEFSELGQLAPFAEVSVIQKKFLPKTGRFQFFGGASLTTNDPFYNTTGLTLRTAYHLTETWSIELNYMTLGSTESRSTKELLEVQNISTDSLAYTKQYLGAAIQFTPIYGKFALYNNKIVPFDHYFAIGTGSTKTQSKDNISTLHLSTGQVFAVTKAWAVRWDFTWNFFSAKAINEEGNINNLIFSLGASFFFPEAKYR
jgi:outer membrane beta-barrel protein